MKVNRNILNQQIVKMGDLPLIHPYAFPIKKARGIRLIDYDGNMYRDFYLQSGCAFLGYKSKPLSTAIHNRLSMGYLGGFFSHLHTRAYKKLQSHFRQKIVGDFSLALFSSPQECEVFLRERGWEVPSVPSHSIFGDIGGEIHNPIRCDYSFTNGAPLEIILFPYDEKIPAFSSPYHSPLILETLLQTLHQWEKSSTTQFLSSLLNPYKKRVIAIQPHIWKLAINDKKTWALTAERLFTEYNILLNPQVPDIAICTQTSANDLQYLFAKLSSEGF